MSLAHSMWIDLKMKYPGFDSNGFGQNTTKEGVLLVGCKSKPKTSGSTVKYLNNNHLYRFLVYFTRARCTMRSFGLQLTLFPLIE